MTIRKILLPLQFAATAPAAFSAAVIVVDCGVACDFLLQRLAAEHSLTVAEERPGADETTVSFAAVIGRAPDVVVAHQARLVDLIVLPHPAGDTGLLLRCASCGAV